MTDSFDHDEVHKLLDILVNVSTYAPDLASIRTEVTTRLREVNAGLEKALADKAKVASDKAAAEAKAKQDKADAEAKAAEPELELAPKPTPARAIPASSLEEPARRL
jgi:hypothetical protein